MGIEEECVCELDFAGKRDCCRDAVENSIVGPRYDLDSDGSFGRGFAGCCWFDLFAGYSWYGSSSLTIRIALSFRHVVVL